MKKIVKQVVGIDVAKDELVVCIGRMDEAWSPELICHKTFSNQQKGFKDLMSFVKKVTDPLIEVGYVMEATGVYHQLLAYYLHEQAQQVSIVLPNKISNYARTLNIKTVTDKTASDAITMFGLERKLDCWAPPKGIYRTLQQLTRERSQLMEDRTIVLNHLHAERSEAMPNKKSIDRANKRLALLDKQELEIKKEVAELIKTDEEVKRIVLLICTIPGIAEWTAATILAETNGFDLIRNKRQLTSYAGLDVKEKLSGTSVKGKPRISKKGNKHLRKAMHMPALAAIRHDERYKAIFARLVAKHGIKMKAAVAIQRKLLEMAFTVFKSQTKFDKKYFENTRKFEKEIIGENILAHAEF